MKDIVIRIPEEIKDYSEKMGGFTLRQWVGIVLIAVLCGGFSIFCNMQNMGQYSFIFNVLFGGTIALVCFVKVNGLPFEKIFPYIKRSFVVYVSVLPKQSERETTMERLLANDKAYRKAKARVERIKETTPEYMLTGRQRQEIYKFEDYKNRLIYTITPYIDKGVMPTPKQVKRIAKEIRRGRC